MIKRLFDIIFSALGILVLLPFFLIIAIIIVADSKGGIFYLQERVGKNESTFKLFKFRSMYTESDKKGLLTVGARDNRITKVGYFLRKTKIDELPQFINVLKGDMAIVGPRPMRLCIFIAIQNVKKSNVLMIKPGLTGYGQLQKLKHEVSLNRECLLNIKYVHTKQSLKKEFLLCIKTIKLIIYNAIKEVIVMRRFLQKIKSVFKIIQLPKLPVKCPKCHKREHVRAYLWGNAMGNLQRHCTCRMCNVIFEEKKPKQFVFTPSEYRRRLKHKLLT